MAGDPSNGGSGYRLGHIIIILAGVAALLATMITCLWVYQNRHAWPAAIFQAKESIWLQTKNYRKPLLQRHVVRILLMVPIYCAASWAALVSFKVAFWIDPFLDVYEAFTIYTFFQLLINFIGGERSLIIMMHGRAPVSHLWPLKYCLPKVDISDPHTFLAIKRGILQYTWVKPLLAIATVAMKATGTYQAGYIGLSSGYFWSGIIYNISITVCLYALALFWVCMSQDLQPFRPMPKFLCIKGIIFASYWQGFFLSILVWLGAIPDVKGYTPDNLAASIQDGLICFEMIGFALAHWYAFSWHDYADVTISAARMPVKYALRDAFGIRDLIQDTKETFAGDRYEYRYFDAGDNVLAHEDSGSRVKRMMEGMRYERGGRGKYWIPKPSQHNVDSETPLLGKFTGSRARAMSPGASHGDEAGDYGTVPSEEAEESTLNPEDERLYENARALEFGDWNYPVITAHQASREDRLFRNPDIITTSTNRNLLQPTSEYKKRRKREIQELQSAADKGKHREGSSSPEPSQNKLSNLPVIGPLLRRQSSSSSSSAKSDRSQLVDLVIEDVEAEQVERVRARKEGSPSWNRTEAKHYVQTYPDAGQAEEVREGYEPSSNAVPNEAQNQHTLDTSFAVGEDDEDNQSASAQHESDEARQWKKRDYTRAEQTLQESSYDYDSFGDRGNVWDKNSPPKG